MLLFAAFALLAFVAWATIMQAWSDGRPWHSAFVAEQWATPITAFIAATVAVTTGWWTVSVTRAAAHAEQVRWDEEKERWEKDRTADRERWEKDRIEQREQARELERREVERTLRDRFHEVAGLLSSEQPRVRQAAAYSLGALSDDWAAHYGAETAKARTEQQVCINTLIAQLRDLVEHEESGGILLEVVALKHVVQDLIIQRLARDHPNSWSSYPLVFDRCYFYDFRADRIEHTGSVLSFKGAQFAGPHTSFDNAKIESGYTTFEDAQFLGITSFEEARFTGGYVAFDRATFRRGTVMRRARMEGLTLLSLEKAQLNSNFVDLTGLRVSAKWIELVDASFMNQDVELVGACIEADEIDVTGSRFSGCKLQSDGARIDAGNLDFSRADFTGAHVNAQGVAIAARSIDFQNIKLGGTVVDVSGSQMSFPRSELLERLDDAAKLTDDGANYTGSTSYVQAPPPGTQTNSVGPA